MSKRLSLREFQENLVRRLAEARTADRRALLGVQAGNENWLIDLTDTGEILPVPPLAPVPLTRSWFRGIANVRGTLYGVLDFSGFHDGPSVIPTGNARLLVLHARHGVNTGLLVSRTSGLRGLDDFEPEGDAEDPRPWVGQKMRDVQNRLWLRLNVRNLLNDPRFLDAGTEQG